MNETLSLGSQNNQLQDHSVTRLLLTAHAEHCRLWFVCGHHYQGSFEELATSPTSALSKWRLLVS